MATTTKIVVGKYRDGMDSTEADSVAKKINDITTAATTYTVSITKQGNKLLAVIVYT